MKILIPQGTAVLVVNSNMRKVIVTWAFHDYHSNSSHSYLTQKKKLSAFNFAQQHDWPVGNAHN